MFLAVLVHFAFLATFTWLNVLSFDIWWTFRFECLNTVWKMKHETHFPFRFQMRSQKLGRRFIFYSLYAWSVPTLIVLFGQIVDNVRVLAKFISQPGFGTLKCWFQCKATFPIQHQNFDFLFSLQLLRRTSSSSTVPCLFSSSATSFSSRWQQRRCAEHGTRTIPVCSTANKRWCN